MQIRSNEEKVNNSSDKVTIKVELSSREYDLVNLFAHDSEAYEVEKAKFRSLGSILESQSRNEQ